MRRRILYVQYTNPAGYPPLEHSSHILAGGGWEVLFLGTRASGSSALEFPQHDRVTVRRLRHYPGGWRQKLHYLCFVIWVVASALRWRPRWIYASDLLSCPIALLLSYWPTLKVLYHEHDSPAAAGNRFNRICIWCRRRLAARAEVCVLPNQPRTEWFQADTNCRRPILSVWNCPRLDELAQRRNAAPGLRLKLYYHGNLSPDLLPATLLDALALFKGRAELRVVGYETNGHQGYLRHLGSHARSLGIEPYVKFIPALPRYELLKVARSCDVGLALMPTENTNVNLRFLAGASNKPFDYMVSGLALLISDLPEWSWMYAQPGYGLTCDRTSVESIAAALRWFMDHPEQTRQMGELGRQRIAAEWNYETQFRPVLERLNRTP